MKTKFHQLHIIFCVKTRLNKKSQKTTFLRWHMPSCGGRNFIFPSFKTTHTTLFWFLGDTQGARFYDKHGTTLHLFVILFPVQYMEKRFALETKLFDKN